jgi:hypothetical protein
MWPFKHRSDDDFRHEIEAHVALETDRLVAEGLSPEEAREAAFRAFGNITAGPRTVLRITAAALAR